MIPRCLTSLWGTEDSLQRSWPASLQSDAHWRKCREVVQSVEAQTFSTSWSWLWPCLWVSQNLLSLLSACRLWPSSAAERIKSYFTTNEQQKEASAAPDLIVLTLIMASVWRFSPSSADSCAWLSMSSPPTSDSPPRRFFFTASSEYGVRWTSLL